MNGADWFGAQLASTAEGLAWAVEQVPARRRYFRPPRALGDWPAARHPFHLLYYEETFALPSMRQWLGAPRPPLDGHDEAAAWKNAPDLEDVIARFRAVRAEQVALVSELAAVDWGEPRPTVWGAMPLRWVVSKTLQHTAEHTHSVLSLALFWDML